MATPINVSRLETLLKQSKYPMEKTRNLIKGFSEGFNMGFNGPRNVRREAPNMRFQVGTKIDLWNKIMKEVKEGHTAGPYRGLEQLPLEYFWQNPVGLIPKKGNSGETRMIVNLSYRDGYSVNHFTNKEECTVKYRDMDAAIAMINEVQKEHGEVFLAKCDGRSAFKQLPVRKEDLEPTSSNESRGSYQRRYVLLY